MIRRSAIFVCLTGALLAGPPALGQDAPAPQDAGPPAAAQPPADAAPPAAPASAPVESSPTVEAQASPPAAGQAAAPVPAGPLVPEPAPVQAQSLDTLDLFSAGRDTGLGADFWKGSSAAIARAVIPTLADKPLSPAGVALARRVLATAATAPEGAGGDTDLAAARASALLALGDAPGVDAILDRTPSLANSAALSQVAAEAALITDQPDKACRIGDALSTGRGGLYWLRLRAYCQARQGKGPEAQLTLTLAEQEGADPDYSRLMTVALAKGGDPGAASLRDGLDYSLSHQLQLDPTPALAAAPLAIAEHVRALTPPPAPPAPTAPGVAPPPPSEADVLAALRAAKGPAEYDFAAKAQAGAIAALVQAKASLAAPVQLATAALAAGDLVSAQAIRAGLVQDTIPGAGPVDLAILDATLAAAAGKPDSQTLDRLAERGGTADGDAKARAQAATAIFAPLSVPASSVVRAALIGFDLGHGDGSEGERLALDLSAAARAKGDVALLALSLAEIGGRAGPVTVDRVRLERALERTGLDADARAFAIEGLIGLQNR